MFKDRLKELRIKNGLTQKELGEKLFVSRSAICKWEMGNGYPSDVNLEALCSFFHVEEDYLMERNDYKGMIKLSETKFKRFIWKFSLIMGCISLFLSFWPCIATTPPVSSFKKYVSVFSLLSLRSTLPLATVLRLTIVLLYFMIISQLVITAFDMLFIKNKLKSRNRFSDFVFRILYGKNRNQGKTNIICIALMIGIWGLFNIIIQLSYRVLWYNL